MAGHWLASRNKDRTGLAQRQDRFDIPNIEGTFGKEVNLLWAWMRALVSSQQYPIWCY
jgi:hypothetical protein